MSRLQRLAKSVGASQLDRFIGKPFAWYWSLPAKRANTSLGKLYGRARAALTGKEVNGPIALEGRIARQPIGTKTKFKHRPRYAIR